MTVTPPPGTYGTADPLFLLLLALAAEAYLGDRAFPRRWFDPRPRVARLASDLARRLDKAERGALARRLRGALVLAAFVLGAVAAGWLLSLATRNYPLAWIVEFLILASLLSQRASYKRLRALREALDTGSLAQARERLRPLVTGLLTGREIDALKRPEVVFLGLAGLAEDFAARLVAPVFWYVLLGPPGLFAFLAVRILSGREHGAGEAAEDESYRHAAVLADRLLRWLPDRVAAAVLAAAAAVLGKSAGEAARALGSATTPAWTALAGALQLDPDDARSAGDREPDPILGDALKLFLVACWVQAGLIAVLALAGL